MALNWIVPARRVVIATEAATYREVLDAWLEQLREHRDTMLGWYRPLAPGRDLARGFDRACRRLEIWIEHFDQGPPEQIDTAAAPEERNHLDELGFWGRLWDGPLRVLKLEQAEAASEEDSEEEEPEPERPDTTPVVSELDVNGPVVVHLDRHQRIVLNHDARFLPGDVVELPLFRLLWLAGVRQFENAAFHPGGSCFLGTSVEDAAGEAPGTVWLHDNLMAMRFQLLFNAARGSFSSFESSFSDSAQTRKARPVDVEGQRVHARGFIYGGSLLSPGRATHFECNTGHWGDTNIPTGGTRQDFVAGTRLTNGWACNPCALNLLAYMAIKEEHWGGGSVNGNARRPGRDSTQWVRDLVEPDHFHHSFRGLGNDTALRYQAERLGIPEAEMTSEAVRDHALRRLFGRPLPPAAIVPEEADEDDDESMHPTTPAPQTAEEIEPHFDASTIVRGGSEGEDEDEPDEPDDDHHQPAPTLDVSAVLPGDQEISVSRDQMLRYMDGAAFAAIGLQGHEYSWVVVHPHTALMAEERQTVAGQAERPPQVGPIAVYDPLTGEPEVAADGEPRMFIFEATGSFHPCRLTGDSSFNFTLFKVRPFRWFEVDEVWFFRDVRTVRRRGVVESKLQIGESSSFSMGGRSHVRSKNLLAISRVPEVAIRRRHLERRTFTPLLLHHVAGRRLAREYERVGYATRAVPFPTLAESNADERYSTLERARQTAQRHTGVIRAELSRFRAMRGRAGHLRPADRSALDVRTPGPSFTRQAERAGTALRQELDGRVAALEGRIRRLRRNLDRHYEPDPGHSRETQSVDQRRTFTAAIAAEQQRLAELGPPRRGRRPPRSRTRREEQLRDAVRDLAEQRRTMPADWARAGEIAAIRAWEQHMEDLLDLLDQGGE